MQTCLFVLSQVEARIKQEKISQKTHGDILHDLKVSEPLSDTVLRMSREQLAAALLEIASPSQSPWLISEVHDVVNRISRDEVVGVPVPTYPQSKNCLKDNSINWFFSPKSNSRSENIQIQEIVILNSCPPINFEQ